MSVDANIIDPDTARAASVDHCGALRVVAAPYPPTLGCSNVQIAPVTALATAAGSSDMRVNGATAPVEFLLRAHPEYQTWLVSATFVIADASMTLSSFGNLTALTNGCRFFYRNTRGEIDIANLLSNFDIVTLCGGHPAFGSGATAFIAANVSGNSEGLVQVYDFAAHLPPHGVRLTRGSQEELVLAVRDDLSTGIDRFQVLVKAYYVVDPE